MNSGYYKPKHRRSDPQIARGAELQIKSPPNRGQRLEFQTVLRRLYLIWQDMVFLLVSNKN